MGSEVPGGSLVAHVRRPTVAGAVNATVTNLTSVKQPRRDPEIRRFQAHFRLIPPCKRIRRVLGGVRRIGGARAVGLTDGAAADRVGGNADPVHVAVAGLHGKGEVLLAYLKFVMRLRWSLHQMLQVLQLNMFERRPLQDLFATPSLPAPSGSQLSLAWS